MNAQEKDHALHLAIIKSTRTDEHTTHTLRNLWIHHTRTLRRAQLTLHRWAEEVCNGTIQRDGEDGDGKPCRVWSGNLYSIKAGRNVYTERRSPVPDRERGALARVEAVCKAASLYYYHQTDPRGCALYVGAVPLTCQNYNTAGVACL